MVALERGREDVLGGLAHRNIAHRTGWLGGNGQHDDSGQERHETVRGRKECSPYYKGRLEGGEGCGCRVAVRCAVAVRFHERLPNPQLNLCTVKRER